MLVDICCRFEIDQDCTTSVDKDISMMAVLMEDSKFVELLQYTLAPLEVSRSRTSGALSLLQHESDRSVGLTDISQKFGSNALA